VNLPYSTPKHRTREELFFDFYSRLQNWASQLVHSDQAAAEDLVHDLYIQFVRVDRLVENVENIEAYLFTALRNLHYSRMRRAGHDPINTFSIVDYDSVELGLAAVDRRQLLFVRSNLKQICKYACQRKETARSASVLILRFFFGYYPSEVMKVTQSSRMAVDRSLQLARKEARQNIERPNIVQPITPRKDISVSFGAGSDDSENLFIQLRETIFSSCEGECFEDSVLEQRYANGSDDGFTTPELAHLVSCKVCLDRANRILGLPLLSERSPEDALDHDSGSGSGSNHRATGISGTLPFAKKSRQRQHLERRVRQLFEHRPSSLQIAVDGDVRASQIVTSEISELYLKLSRPEQPAFIEVLSEQGLCLVYLQVEQPAYVSGLAQAQSIKLSDDRTLHLSLFFATEGPLVHVLYEDPILAESDAKVSDTRTEFDRSGKLVGYSDKAKPMRRNHIHWVIVRMRLQLRSLWRSKVISHMNPLLLTGAVLAIASIVCLSLWMWQPAKIAPETLLQHAVLLEATVEVGPSQVIRQRVRISTPKRTLERSIYRDSTGRRHAQEFPLDSETSGLKAELATSGISWDKPLSADSYRNWHDHVRVQKDTVDSSKKGFLTLITAVARGDISQESLTVRASDFHPVARSVSIEGEGTIEIAELEYEQIPWSEMKPGIFDRLPGENLRGNLPSLSRPISHAFRGPLDEGQLDEAELGTLFVLQQLHADGDNRIQVVRRPDGIQVHGIVENDARKRELEANLNTVPHVIPAIFTFQELDAKPQKATEADVQSGPLEMQLDEKQVSPLESFLLTRGYSHEKINAVADRLSDSAMAINRETTQLADLSHRYRSHADLSPAALEMLNKLVDQRNASILAALDEEAQALSDIGIVETSLAETQQNDAEINVVAKRNYELCRELVFGAATHSRQAQDILPVISNTLHQLRVAALRSETPTALRMAARKEQ
jgi:DNA-directed RNA polymerase specialized sigma24 family protein